MCRLSLGAGDAPPPELPPGASQCAPCLTFAFMALQAKSWICCPQLPYHPSKNGTHSTCFCSTGGHTPNINLLFFPLFPYFKINKHKKREWGTRNGYEAGPVVESLLVRAPNRGSKESRKTPEALRGQAARGPVLIPPPPSYNHWAKCKRGLRNLGLKPQISRESLIIRHRRPGPHPRIRLALPSSGFDFASIQHPIRHRNRVKSGNRCRINVKSMWDRCQIDPEEGRARRIRGWGPGRLCLISPSQPKFPEKIGGKSFLGNRAFSSQIGAFSVSGPVRGRSGPIPPHSTATRGEQKLTRNFPKGPFWAKVAPFGPSPRLLSPCLDFSEIMI